MRPKTFLINMQDPDRALDDPGLRALVAAGWTCAASWPVVRTDNSGGHESVQMMLVLWPPSPAAVTTSWLTLATYAFPLVVAAGVVASIVTYVAAS